MADKVRCGCSDDSVQAADAVSTNTAHNIVHRSRLPANHQVLLQGRGLYGRGAVTVGEHIHPFTLLHYM